MAIQAAAVWFSTFAVLVTILLLRRLHRRRSNLPPGPRAWPVIGNLFLIGPSPHKSLHVLSQKYGPIMHLWLGSNSVVVGSSVKMAKAFLKTHDGSLASRPRTAAGKFTGSDHSNILWAPYSPYWRQVRKLCFSELFSPKSLESYEYIRKEEIRIMANQLYSSSGKTIFLADYLNVFNLNVISSMVLGKTYVKKTENAVITPDEFKWMLDEFLFLNSGFLNIGDFIPWLELLDLQGYVKRMKVVSKKFERFLEPILNEHNDRRKGIKNYVARDMVDLLLQAADDPSLEVKFQRHNMKAVTEDLLIGGTHSSSIAVEWAMSELLKKPQVLKKAQQELHNVVGRNRWVEEQDMVNLPYIKAIVKETLRLHPVAPTLVPREAREHCKIAGYDIPKGTQVILNVWAIGRDPKVWACPNEFEPEKFIDGNRWVEEQDMVNLPYIKAIVKETLRLHPVAPTLVPREAREHCKIAGYDIPKGTQVILNVWAIGRDPKVWACPNEFEPEKFIDGPAKEIDVMGHDFELLPFGAGRRMCPGYLLGLKVIQSSLANLVHGFRWKLAGNMKAHDLNMEEVGGLAIAKKVPLEAWVEPSLALHLYSLD